MSPGTAYVLLHHYMGEVDGSVGAWGYARGGMGAITEGAVGELPGVGRHDPHRREVDHVLVKNGKATGVGARQWRGDFAASWSSPTPT